MWKDGTCNSCGSIVEEMSSQGQERIQPYFGSEDECYDYMNRCANLSCKNHIWHFVGDDEELDYYTHEVGEDITHGNE
jgi:hypothetical protein